MPAMKLSIRQRIYAWIAWPMLRTVAPLIVPKPDMMPKAGIIPEAHKPLIGWRGNIALVVVMAVTIAALFVEMALNVIGSIKKQPRNTKPCAQDATRRVDTPAGGS